MAKKRTKAGYKKGKHGTSSDLFDNIDEAQIRKEIRENLKESGSKKNAFLPYLILILVIVGIIAGGVVFEVFLNKDNDTPGSTTGEVEEIIHGLELKIVTKEGGDGDHKPFEYSRHKVDPSRGTQYLLLVKNKGEAADSFEFSANAPKGWIVTFPKGATVKDVPSNEWMYQIVTIKVQTDVEDNKKDIKITAASLSDKTISDSVTTKNTVEAFPPGEADLARHPAKVDYNLVYKGGGWDEKKKSGERGWYHNQGSEFEATQVIRGFEEGIKGMRVGETKVVVVPPEKGYTKKDHELYGKTLVFEITMVDINTEN